MTKDNCSPRNVLNEVNNIFINQYPEIASDHFILNIDRNPQNFNEVLNTITQLKNTSSTGKDGIPVRILKAVANEIARPLTHINLMFPTGKLPSVLMCAVVRAIHKISSVTPQSLVQYADNAYFIFSDYSLENQNSKVLEVLGVSQEWFAENDILLDVDKTKIPVFDYGTKESTRVLLDGDVGLQCGDSVCLLGVNIDHRLDWRVHTDELAKTISKSTFALRIISLNIDMNIAIATYHGCIIFGSDQEVAGVMRAVRRSNATRSFSWIGSDGWSARSLVSDGNEDVVEGTLSVQPQANPVKGFEEYFLSLDVKNNQRNPWFIAEDTIVSRQVREYQCLVQTSLYSEEIGNAHKVLITVVSRLD
ncbi:hypothetical protein HHI36_007569 [Cryptolaemus montrouzieri]|uniref:Reverse transcriptase domain-containing protein n=1 Tax=Cryptolaemus montrouzieri TaxID=559131 RepID=A0ABD2MPW2_9CUCU